MQKIKMLSRSQLFTFFGLLIVFVFDFLVPLGVAIGVLYLCCFALILRESKKTILVFTIVSTFLILLKFFYFFSPETFNWMVVLNRGISVAAIIIVSIITLRYRTQEENKAELIELHNAYNLAIDQNIISCVCDLNGKIITANKKFCEISKYTEEELEGQPYSIVNSGFHPKEFFTNLWKTIESGKLWHGEIKNKDKDGIYYWVDAVVLPINNFKGNRIQYLTLQTVITTRKKAEFILKEENNRFTTTMNAIDAVVYVSDMETHEILFTNNYVTNVFGNIVGKKCYAALQQKTAPCEFCTNHLLLDAKGNVNPPYVWESQNLITKRWYQCHDQAIQWTNGKLARFETATDITINKENEQSLKEHEIKLQELNATKDKFFSIIAHDLKTPFTVLKNGTYLLSKHLENNDLQKSKEKAQMISNATKNTYELLDNLLLWAKSQTGRTALNLKNISLTNSLSRNIKELENQANQKNISIINKITDELILEADENLLSTVFRNLITNAIKFTHSGGKVTIQAKLTDNHIEIAVIDTGIGIPKEHHDKLFRLDVNYSRVGTANEASTSLGLILCKEFIEKHNGKIWFKSEVEKGSTFKVQLPVKQ